MVLWAYEKHVAGPRREAIARAEKAEKELAEERAMTRAWNERRLLAEARGERFDEPHPGDDESR